MILQYYLKILNAKLLAGVGWKVIECNAHDGLGESSQKLLDEFGCPIDELLLPAPLKGIPKVVTLMRYQEAVTQFPAFKFPDRDRLHLSCGLLLCRGNCFQVDKTSTVKNLFIDMASFFIEVLAYEINLKKLHCSATKSSFK